MSSVQSLTNCSFLSTFSISIIILSLPQISIKIEHLDILFDIISDSSLFNSLCMEESSKLESSWQFSSAKHFEDGSKCVILKSNSISLIDSDIQSVLLVCIFGAFLGSHPYLQGMEIFLFLSQLYCPGASLLHLTLLSHHCWCERQILNLQEISCN